MHTVLRRSRLSLLYVCNNRIVELFLYTCVEAWQVLDGKIWHVMANTARCSPRPTLQPAPRFHPIFLSQASLNFEDPELKALIADLPETPAKARHECLERCGLPIDSYLVPCDHDGLDGKRRRLRT